MDDEHKQEILEFLDELQESGATSMFGAVPYICDKYRDVTALEASVVLIEWLETFGER